MICRGCGYSLIGMNERLCPECGRAFDPDNPATYETPEVDRAPALHLWLRVLACAAATAPLLNTFSGLLCWIVAWMALGRPPRPSADDPRTIGSVQLPYQWWDATGNPACLSIVIGLGLPLGLLLLRGSRIQMRNSRRVAVATLGTWAVFVCVFLSRIGSWLGD